jgi:hypothetical protein
MSFCDYLLRPFCLNSSLKYFASFLFFSSYFFPLGGEVFFLQYVVRKMEYLPFKTEGENKNTMRKKSKREIDNKNVGKGWENSLEKETE